MNTCDRCGKKAITFTEVEDNGQIIEVCKDCAKKGEINNEQPN